MLGASCRAQQHPHPAAWLCPWLRRHLHWKTRVDTPLRPTAASWLGDLGSGFDLSGLGVCPLSSRYLWASKPAWETREETSNPNTETKKRNGSAKGWPRSSLQAGLELPRTSGRGEASHPPSQASSHRPCPCCWRLPALPGPGTVRLPHPILWAPLSSAGPPRCPA